MGSRKRQTSSIYPLQKPSLASFKRNRWFDYSKRTVCLNQTKGLITANGWFSYTISFIFQGNKYKIKRDNAYSCNCSCSLFSVWPFSFFPFFVNILKTEQIPRYMKVPCIRRQAETFI